MWDKHDRWLDQLSEFFEALSGYELDDDDRIVLSNLAARMMRGEASLHETTEAMARYIAGHYGVMHYHSQEEFEAMADVENMIDVTEGTKANLEIAGEPGIADALIQIYASDEARDWDPGWKARPDQPAIALGAKHWFDLTKMNPDEMKAFHWAITTALKDHPGAN